MSAALIARWNHNLRETLPLWVHCYQAESKLTRNSPFMGALLPGRIITYAKLSLYECTVTRQNHNLRETLPLWVHCYQAESKLTRHSPFMGALLPGRIITYAKLSL